MGVQQGAGDAGGAIGIALAIWHRYLGNERTSTEKSGTWRSLRDQNSNGLPPYADGMKGSFLGPQNTVAEIEEILRTRKRPYQKYSREQFPVFVAGFLS